MCDQSKKLLVCTTSNIKIPGQGDTHRVKMKSKASSQTTDAVVAEWQSACETHGFAILSQTLRSVLISALQMTTYVSYSHASGNMSKHQPARKRLKKSTLAASTLSHAVFSYVQTSNKLGIHVPSDTLQWQEHFKWQSSGMLVFHMYKPQANLVQTSNLWGRTMPAGATGF